jgi:hypothetical protein
MSILTKRALFPRHWLRLQPLCQESPPHEVIFPDDNASSDLFGSRSQFNSRRGSPPVQLVLPVEMTAAILREVSEPKKVIHQEVAKLTGNYEIKYKAGDSTKTLLVEYNPKFIEKVQKLPKESIRLESKKTTESRLNTVALAKKLARRIEEGKNKDEFTHLEVNKDTKIIGRTKFRQIIKQIAGSDRNFDGADTDEGLIALTGFYSMITDHDELLKKQNGFLDKIHPGLYNANDDNFLAISELLMKHYFFDLKGIQSPADLEKSKGVYPELDKLGLRSIVRAFELTDLYRMVCRKGFFEGSNPIVRDWVLQSTTAKWGGEEGKNTARKAVQWVLKYGEKVVNEDGSYNLETIKDTNWGEVFSKDEYGLKSMYACCPHTKNVRDALKLAAPDLIGLEEHNIKPWQIRTKHMWKDQGSDGKLLIDNVTNYIVEHRLPDEGIKVLNADGNLNPEIAKEVNWARMYDLVAPGCQLRSGVKAHEALQRVCPNSFGYNDDQIKPQQFSWEGKWDEKEGVELFRKGFAYNLAKAGLARIVSTPLSTVVTIDKDSFERAYETNFRSQQKSLRTILDHGAVSISGGFEKIAQNKLGVAIKLLFKIEAAENLETESVNRSFLELLSRNGGSYSIELANVGIKPNAEVVPEPILDPVPETIIETKTVIESIAEVKVEPNSEVQMGTKPIAAVDRPILNYPTDYVQRQVSPVRETIKTSPVAGLRMLRWLRSIKVNFDSDVFGYSVAVFKHSCIEAGVSEEIIRNYETNSDDFEKLRKYLVLNEKSMKDVLDKMKQLSAGRKNQYTLVAPLGVEKTPEADY